MFEGALPPGERRPIPGSRSLSHREERRLLARHARAGVGSQIVLPDGSGSCYIWDATQLRPWPPTENTADAVPTCCGTGWYVRLFYRE
jgi:hypothetical protein